MKKKPDSEGAPVFKNFRHLIIHPTTKEVDEINDFIFNYCAKRWAANHSFFPVLRLIEADKISIKLYYDERHSSDHRQLEELSVTCYRELIEGFDYSTCNIIRIPFSVEISKAEILKCNSMKELEKIFLDSLNDQSYVGCFLGEGGLTIGAGRVPRQFELWNSLIEQGYLEPEYEEKCRIRRKNELMAIKESKQIEMEEEEREKEKNERNSIQIKLVEQPTTLDAEAIDNFFKANHANEWAMKKGFTSTFTDYKDGKIYFTILSNPDFTMDEYAISKFIAGEYRNCVDVLKGANTYEAIHFIPKDPMEFRIKAIAMFIQQRFNIKPSLVSPDLSNNPDFIHSGLII